MVEEGQPVGAHLIAWPILERIVKVHNDDIEPGGRLLENCLGIVDYELEPRVRKRFGVLGQVLAAEFYDILVNVDHHAALNSVVPQDLARCAALAAAANVHRLGARVRKQRRVDKRLVIDVFVDLA